MSLNFESVKAGPANPDKASDKNPEGKPSPSVLEFALIYNGSNTRQDVVKTLQERGFHMTYGALIQRESSYTKEDREGGPIALKEMQNAKRGRKINSAEVNAALAAAAGEQKSEGEGETPAEG